MLLPHVHFTASTSARYLGYVLCFWILSDAPLRAACTYPLVHISVKVIHIIHNLIHSLSYLTAHRLHGSAIAYLPIYKG